MSDIVERLRELTMREVSQGGYCREEPVPLNRDGPEAADTIAALRAEVVRLRDALEPFALLANKIRPDDPDNDRPAFARNLDYRRARAALTQTKDTTDG